MNGATTTIIDTASAGPSYDPGAVLAVQDDGEALARVIREAIDDADPGWSTMVSARAPATHTGGPRIMARSLATIHDRDDGRHFPYYETEWDLVRERNKWRRLDAFTSVAVGAMQALQSYTMGGEWEYEVVPRPDMDPSPELVRECNRIIQAVLEKNNFVGDLDNEIHDTSRVDGEALVAGYATRDGLTDFRRLDADNLREPANASQLSHWLWLDPKLHSWSFGVLTGYCDRQKRIDHARHLGYHVVFDDAGSQWDYIPCWPTSVGDDDLDGKFLQQVKRNVPRKAKRGISDYWPVLVDLEREEKLNENTTVGAAVQAAIAWWEELPPNARKEGAEQQISAALDAFSSRLTNSRGGERPVNAMRPGTVPKISAGRKIIAGPLGQQRSPIFTEVRQAVMRRIGLRWCMPEYLITGDASNNNFASSLVAEAPFVKARENDQRRYAADFREMFTKVLKVACDAGRFRRWTRDWATLGRLVEIRVKPSPVATRDKSQQMQELFGMYDRGALDANELRIETRREEKPELAGKTGGGPPLTGAEAYLARQGVNTRVASIERAVGGVRTLAESRAFVRSVLRETSDCGANAPGGGGFQPGNTCAASIDGDIDELLSALSDREDARNDRGDDDEFYRHDDRIKAAAQKILAATFPDAKIYAGQGGTDSHYFDVAQGDSLITVRVSNHPNKSRLHGGSLAANIVLGDDPDEVKLQLDLAKQALEEYDN